MNQQLHPWTVTVMIDGDEEIYFQAPPAETIGFHRAQELTGEPSIYAGDLVVTADGVQIARLSEWTGAYATPGDHITPLQAYGLAREIPASPTTPTRNYTNPTVQP